MPSVAAAAITYSKSMEMVSEAVAGRQVERGQRKGRDADREEDDIEHAAVLSGRPRRRADPRQASFVPPPLTAVAVEAGGANARLFGRFLIKGRALFGGLYI